MPASSSGVAGGVGGEPCTEATSGRLVRRRCWIPLGIAARIRAFFVAPEAARQGVGRRLFDACISAAAEAGFESVELMSTLPGVPFYAALGCDAVEHVTDTLPDGVALRFVRMHLQLSHPGNA